MAEEQSATDSVTTSERNGSAPARSTPAPREGRKIQMSKTPFPTPAMPMGYDEITKILPHRYPLLLVDRITELEPGNRCVGLKNVTFNEEYFQGHFPGHPVMPGVLILEAMAQVAGLLTLVSRNSPGALSYFATIENARFRRPVSPGDQLVTEATLNVLRGALCKVHVVGRVDNFVVVEADYIFMTDARPDSTTAIMSANGMAGTQKLSPAVAQTPLASPVHAPPAERLLSVANGGPPVAAGQAAFSPQAPATQQLSPIAVTPSAAGEVTSPPRTGSGKTYVHSSALVDRTAEIGEGVWIGPYCVVEGGTKIGANTVLEANVILKRGTSVGERCRLWPNVVLGHEPQDMKFKGEESFVEIGDDNMLREMVTVHRASGEGACTRIGNQNLLMAYAHVGHNCIIGNNTMISNSSGISGHVTIEDKVVIGGFAGLHQFVHIGKMGMVGGLSKVVQDLPPFCICDGRPAKVNGLNVRGLRRNGVPSEVRNQVGVAFRLLYRSGLNTSQALERIHAEVPRSETLDYFIGFIERVREGRLGRQDETPHF